MAAAIPSALALQICPPYCSLVSASACFRSWQTNGNRCPLPLSLPPPPWLGSCPPQQLGGHFPSQLLLSARKLGVWRPVEFQAVQTLDRQYMNKILQNIFQWCDTRALPACEMGLLQCSLKGETHISNIFFFPSPVPGVSMPCPAVGLVVPRWLGTTAGVALVRVRTCWQAPCSSQRGPQTWLTKTR